MYKIYENIKKLRLSHNMSQQELAEAVGYKGKSMIAKIEKGEVDLPTTMVTKFAEVFDCSESFLMGWEDNDKRIDALVRLGAYERGVNLAILSQEDNLDVIPYAKKLCDLSYEQRKRIYSYIDFIHSQEPKQNQE